MGHVKMPATRLPRSRPVPREPWILDACRGRSVLHVGCADAPFTRERFESGTLLHQRLATVADRLAGIDLDVRAIDWLTERGMENLHAADAAQLSDVLPKVGFAPEVIVAGEVLEHLSQPLDFLTGVRDGMGPGARLVLSVPNAFYLQGWIHVLLGRERVHPEHVAYYSYRTLHELVGRARLVVEEIHPYMEPLHGAAARAIHAATAPLRWLQPHLAMGYVAALRRPD